MSDAIEQGDTVRVENGRNAGEYGQVLGFKKKHVLVDLTGEGNPETAQKYRESSLSVIPPTVLDQDGLRQLCRFEVPPSRLRGSSEYAPLETNAHHQMTLDDLRAALQNIKDHGGPDSQEALDWYFQTFEQFGDELGIWQYIDGQAAFGQKDAREIPGIPNARSLFSDIYDELQCRYDYGEQSASFEELLSWIDAYQADCGKPLAERRLSERQKETFLNCWDMGKVEATDIPGIRELYVKTVNELAAADNPVGLYQKAYACYGDGCAGFEQDWQASRDCLLKLEQIAPSSLYANTLGYLYYYGRCTQGTPEYDKAFYWFSIGAAGGNYESRYKLSDMFKAGKGCPQDPEIAAHIIWDLFNENLPYFCTGHSLSKFADIALRAGNLEASGPYGVPDYDSAYAYYLMARLAIRMRRQACDYYGDTSVERNIDDALISARPKTSYAEKQDRISFDESTLPRLLRFALGGGRRIEMDYRWKDTDKGNLKLTFRVQNRQADLDAHTHYAAKFPVLIPEAHFCGMCEKLVVWGTVQRSAAYGLVGKRGAIVFDDMGNDWGSFGKLALYGKLTGILHGAFTVNCKKLSGKQRRYASVSFDDPERTWNYLCDDESVRAGDTVRVPWGNTEREGSVARITWRYDSEMELFRRDYKRIIEKR